MKDILSFFKDAHKVYSIQEIKSWLLDNIDYYLELFDRLDADRNLIYRIHNRDENMILEYNFITQYEALTNLVMIGQYENYFESQLIFYNKNKEDKTAILTLLINNECLGSGFYFSHILYYLEYNKQEFWKIESAGYNLPNPFSFNLEISTFRNTIEFLEIFYNNYWEGNIVPKNHPDCKVSIHNFYQMSDSVIVGKYDIPATEREDNYIVNYNDSDVKFKDEELPF